MPNGRARVFATSKAHATMMQRVGQEEMDDRLVRVFLDRAMQELLYAVDRLR
jgi:hypothetical protein